MGGYILYGRRVKCQCRRGHYVSQGQEKTYVRTTHRARHLPTGWALSRNFLHRNKEAVRRREGTILDDDSIMEIAFSTVVERAKLELELARMKNAKGTAVVKNERSGYYTNKL